MFSLLKSGQSCLICVYIGMRDPTFKELCNTSKDGCSRCSLATKAIQALANRNEFINQDTRISVDSSFEISIYLDKAHSLVIFAARGEFALRFH
jgi:hypothetical protein